MSTDDLRPTLRPSINYKDLGLPEGQVIHRLETYRMKRRWFEFWKPKYNQRMYALTNNAIYDITDAIEEQKQ